MQLLQERHRRAIGAEIHAGVAQMVFHRVFIEERRGPIRRTPPFAVVNGFEVGPRVFDAADIVFGGPAAGDGFGEFFPVCCVGCGDGVRVFC